MTRTGERCYFKIRYGGGYLHYVYVDTEIDGTTSYWEEESGDVRSFPFKPSDELKNILTALRAQGHGRDGWTMVDLDSGGISMMSLAGFAAYVRGRSGEQTGAWLERMIGAYESSRVSARAPFDAGDSKS